MNNLRVFKLFVLCLLLTSFVACSKPSTTTNNPIDQEPPTINLRENTDTTFYNKSALLSFEVKDTSSLQKLSFQLNSAAWRDILPLLKNELLELQLEGLLEGKNRLSILAIDEQNNEKQYDFELSYILDALAPTLTVVGPNERVTNARQYTLKGVLKDDHSVKSLSYQLNENERIDISDKLTETGFILPLELEEGENYLNLVGFDKAENRIAKNLLIILDSTLSDTIPPILLINEPDRTVTKSSVEVMGQVTDNLNVNQLAYTLNDGKFNDITHTIDGANYRFWVEGLVEGDNTITLRASDVSGNIVKGKINVTYISTGDKEAPILAITNGEKRTVSSSTATITGTVTDNLGVKAFSYRLNGGNEENIFTQLAGTFFSLEISNLKEGENLIVLLASDEAGNQTEKTVTINFTKELPAFPNVEGVWGGQSSVPVCPNDSATAVSFSFDRVGTDGTVNGTGQIANSYGEYISTANFKGQITRSGILTGSFNFTGDNVNGAASVNLSYSGSSLKGQLSFTATAKCDQSTTGSKVVNVDLKKDVLVPVPSDDAFEPNDDKASAKAIEIGKTYDLIKLSLDQDWFKFNLTEAVLVSIEVDTDKVLYTLEGNKTYGYPMKQKSILMALQKGTHYIHVTSHSYSPEKYSLKIVTSPLPDKANEPNNTKATATPLTLGTTQTAYLYPEDKDWYTFSLTEAMIFDYTFKQINPSQPYLSQFFALYNESEEVSFGYLIPGRYYLEIFGEEYTYSLSTQVTPPTDSAYEPNETFETAREIKTDTAHNFYLGNGDHDWFKFNLTSDSNVNILQSGSLVEYQLYDADKTQLFSSYYSSYQTYLPSGIYYLYVLEQSDTDYTINIKTRDVSDAYEPNNSQDSAHAISSDFSGSFLVFPDDTDWFKFSIGDTFFLDVALKAKGAYVNVRLLNSKGTQLEAPVLESSKKYLLEPDTYYLQFMDTQLEVPVTMTLTPNPLPDASFEPNDTLEQATPILLNQKYETYLRVKDKDYYSFSLDKQQLVIANNEYSVANPRLIDSSGNFMNVKTYDDPSFSSFVLPKGTYYWLVEAASDLKELGASYPLQISTRDYSDDQYEPNDTISTATLIDLTFADSNLFLKEGANYNDDFNEDWYKFVLDKKSFVSLKFNMDVNWYGNSSISLNLISADGTVNNKFDKILEGVLAPGTYYLKVGGHHSFISWLFGAKYGLNILASPL
ncbi:MAG: hypothetical protein KC422_10890 [Trueperaceae bacterium]|nr:hypothetical protein [Trueperaceae bacterium]